MKVRVIEDNCIGCGYCEGICDQVFNVEDISHVIVDSVPQELEDNVMEAIEDVQLVQLKKLKNKNHLSISDFFV
jgi:ferredoxin